MVPVRELVVPLAATLKLNEPVPDRPPLVIVIQGTVLAGVTPTWSSGDPSVAEVSPAGTVAIRGPGTAVILVQVGSVETRAHIVVAQRAAALQVDDTLLQVPEGDRRPLSARVLDARGNPIVGADVLTTYRSASDMIDRKWEQFSGTNRERSEAMDGASFPYPAWHPGDVAAGRAHDDIRPAFGRDSGCTRWHLAHHSRAGDRE